jgi:DNA-binding CsgD family transcriptional regulator
VPKNRGVVVGIEDDAHSVITGIYDAALEPSLWEPVLERLSDVLRGALITFHVQDGAGRIRLWRGVRADPVTTDRFLSDRRYTEPSLKPMAALLAKPSATFVLREAVQSDVDFRGSAMYNDIIRPQGLWHWGFSTVARESDFAAIFGILRRQGAGAYDDRERDLLTLLMPHFQRAAQISLRLGALDKGQEVFAFELLETLSVGVAIVTADARLLYANRIAEKVLRTGEGLRVLQGCLRPQAIIDVRAFERAVFDAARTRLEGGMASGGMMHLRRSDRASLAVLIAPLGVTGLGTALPSVAVIFADPDVATETPWQMLAWRWGLTRAEARLLAAIAGGQDLSSYADAAEIGVGTARTHLKQIFAKTGYRRQADLVRAVCSDPLMRLQPLLREGSNL